MIIFYSELTDVEHCDMLEKLLCQMYKNIYLNQTFTYKHKLFLYMY